VISVRNISKSYGSLEVLHDISLDINKGEVLSIVGPSGAGKTTLLQIIGTLDRPDSGSVLFDGEDVAKFKEKRLARFRCEQIGFVFQFHQLLPEFTVLENVAIPAMIAGVSRKKSFERAAELINYLGLADRGVHKPSELSGGECQRAAVARALVNSPAVVLADEPSGSLDSHNRDELHRLFFKLRNEMGQTFVIVTHDEHLASTCDRIVHMSDGRIVEIDNRNIVDTVI
jgi:lipoprotein-releasing system ATP-binding protein